jgi:hypothetical protein
MITIRNLLPLDMILDDRAFLVKNLMPLVMRFRFVMISLVMLIFVWQPKESLILICHINENFLKSGNQEKRSRFKITKAKKRKILTLSQKKQVIEEVTVRKRRLVDVAKDFDVDPSSVSKIIRKSEHIVNTLQNNPQYYRKKRVLPLKHLRFVQIFKNYPLTQLNIHLDWKKL